MPRVGFESTAPVFERTKTVHTLDRAAAVIGAGGILRAWNLVSDMKGGTYTEENIWTEEG
jgi:hypothetical protein